MSTKRVTIRGTEYPVGKLNSVTVDKHAPKKISPRVLITFGLLAVGMVVLDITQPEDQRNSLQAAVFFFVAIACFGLAWNSRKPSVPSWNLTFETNGGKVQAYSTGDEDEINAIRDAINDAIDAQSNGGSGPEKEPAEVTESE